MAGEFLNISQISSEGRLLAPIRVKLLRIWEISPATVPQPLKNWIFFILSDEEGRKIEMSITDDLMPRFYSMMSKESHWFNLRDVYVTSNTVLYSHTHHGFHLHATRSTSLDEVPAMNNNNYLDIVDIRDIIDLSFTSDIPISTVGAVGVFRDMVVNTDNPLASEFHFEILDDRARPLRCYATGKCALDFQRQWSQQTLGVVVCVFRFWRIMRVGGDIVWLTSRPDISDVLFDPDFPEVRAMKARLPFTDL